MLKDKRLFHLDALRIISSVFVIVIHICILNWYTLSPTSLSWQALNVFESISQVAVPVFFMISGALYLDENKEITIKEILLKRIPRLLIVYFVWSFVYLMINPEKSFGSSVFKLLDGHFHMWFIPAIIGLYLVIPFLRVIVKSETLTKYFLILSVIFTFTIYFVAPLLEGSSVKVFSLAGEVLGMLKSKLALRMVLGYSGYFVFGYFLQKTAFSKVVRRIIYLMGISALLSTICFSYLISVHRNKATDVFYSNTSLNILIESVAIFVFAKYNLCFKNIGDKGAKTLTFLSKCTFGVYLVHPVFIDIINKHFHISAVTVNPLVAVPLYTLAVLILSFSVSALLNKIPFVKKYIV